MAMLLLSMLVPRSTDRPKLKAQGMPKHNWRTSTLHCWYKSLSKSCLFPCLKVYCCQGTVAIHQADLLLILEHQVRFLPRVVPVRNCQALQLLRLHDILCFISPVDPNDLCFSHGHKLLPLAKLVLLLLLRLEAG